MSSFRDVVTPSTDSTSAERLLGRVKWFNSKAGYGFITVTDGERSGSDIFVHHSAINVENQQYRYLVQGEYVEFSLIATPNGNHEFQASSVCGIRSGKLMCETRREFKIARNNYRASASSVSSNDDANRQQVEMPVQRGVNRQPRNNAPRLRGNGPREDNKDWTLVSKDSNRNRAVQSNHSQTQAQPQSQSSRQPENNRPRRGRPSKATQQS